MNATQIFRRAQPFLFLSLSLLFWGCATPIDRTPEWIAGVEGVGPEGHRIVAYGRGPTSSAAAGSLSDDVAAQIAQILVMRLEAEGVVYSAATEDRIQTVAERRQELVTPEDEYRRNDSTGAVERYALILYGNREIEADVRMIRDALPLPVAAPEDVAGASPLLAELEALLSSSIPETEVDRRLLLEEALTLASSLEITIRPGDQTMPLGDTPAGTYAVSLRESDSTRPYPGERLRVQVVSPPVDGVRETEVFEVVTDENGTARFPVPPVGVSGAWSVTVEPLRLYRLATRWTTSVSSQETRDLFTAVQDRTRGRSILRVTSRAADIPTGIIVLDRDIAGNPIDSGDTMRGMIQEFADSGFRIREVELTAVERRRLVALDSLSVSDLYDVLPFEVLSRVDRVIVGDAVIREFTEGDGFSVVVEVNASTFDLRRDRRLVRVSFEERVSGSDSRAAIRAAFQASGRRLVRQTVPRLP
jgi:hypothetical protein